MVVVLKFGPVSRSQLSSAKSINRPPSRQLSNMGNRLCPHLQRRPSAGYNQNTRLDSYHPQSLASGPKCTPTHRKILRRRHRRFFSDQPPRWCNIQPKGEYVVGVHRPFLRRRFRAPEGYAITRSKPQSIPLGTSRSPKIELSGSLRRKTFPAKPQFG